MKPRKKIDETLTPNGSKLTLYLHDNDYYLQVDGYELMSSRRHESELELGRIGCQHLTSDSEPSVLIGGLGMGYTLRACLDELSANAEVVVAELLPEVVRWNQEVFGHLADHPLKDSRTVLEVKNVIEVLKESTDRFDSILLDIDNGPEALSDADNDNLYTQDGILIVIQALKRTGRLCVWSAGPDHDFEKRLKRVGLNVSSQKVKAFKTAKKSSHYIITANYPV